MNILYPNPDMVLAIIMVRSVKVIQVTDTSQINIYRLPPCGSLEEGRSGVGEEIKKEKRGGIEVVMNRS
jgi:hypothetical protein